ncbi:hypothetical protein [Candidatus Accumulibacter sp. ACC012]|uniref:hypothetical protein n=1 Tax=Candidatus Accumulibacter sp. ACC012 TaxID=2823332 RepID=UPI0025B84930|nr:hypothetical protein [Candidatus Accumulibacter sp. ACC012]
MAVNNPSEKPFPTDEMLGIAIGTPNSPNQRHIGFIYRLNEESDPRFCHLAWHHILCDELYEPPYLWGASALDQVNNTVMAAYVATLQQNSNVVNYGFSVDGLFFRDDGQYVVQPIGRGLTCATFILVVLRRNGFELLKTDDWGDRPGDAEWQNQIIEVLDRCAPEHAEAMKQDIGASRFRPEEVAGGMISEGIPLSLSDAEKLAGEILQDIQRASSTGLNN